MSLIEFESSRVKEAERENLRRAREKILAEVRLLIRNIILFVAINK